MTRATDPGTEESWRASHRGLVIVLGVQFVIGAALLIWVAMGRPVPGLVQNADGKGNPNTTTPVPTVNHFDGRYAFALLTREVAHYGPRPAGSKASYALAKDLVKRLPNGTFEPVPEPQHNVIKLANGGFVTAPHGLRNIVGSLPGKGAPLVIGAHYDTEASIPGHIGANDGAAGTAAVVELARALSHIDRGPEAPPLRFVLFDGEEEPGDEPDPKLFESVALRGSKFEAQHQPRPQAMILLDYIAQTKGLRLPREGFSDKTVWKKLRTAAGQVGTLRLFPDATGESILDDHYPFIGRKIPAIDLIDFDYPVADTLQDDLHHVSELSLDAVGETVLQMVRTWK